MVFQQVHLNEEHLKNQDQPVDNERALRRKLVDPIQKIECVKHVQRYIDIHIYDYRNKAPLVIKKHTGLDLNPPFPGATPHFAPGVVGCVLAPIV